MVSVQELIQLLLKAVKCDNRDAIAPMLTYLINLADAHTDRQYLTSLAYGLLQQRALEDLEFDNSSHGITDILVRGSLVGSQPLRTNTLILPCRFAYADPVRIQSPAECRRLLGFPETVDEVMQHSRYGTLVKQLAQFSTMGGCPSDAPAITCLVFPYQDTLALPAMLYLLSDCVDKVLYDSGLLKTKTIKFRVALWPQLIDIVGKQIPKKLQPHIGYMSSDVKSHAFPSDSQKEEKRKYVVAELFNPDSRPKFFAVRYIESSTKRHIIEDVYNYAGYYIETDHLLELHEQVDTGSEVPKNAQIRKFRTAHLTDNLANEEYLLLTRLASGLLPGNSAVVPTLAGQAWLRYSGLYMPSMGRLSANLVRYPEGVDPIGVFCYGIRGSESTKMSIGHSIVDICRELIETTRNVIKQQNFKSVAKLADLYLTPLHLADSNYFGTLRLIPKETLINLIVNRDAYLTPPHYEEMCRSFSGDIATKSTWEPERAK